jgi:hypothetical protein
MNAKRTTAADVRNARLERERASTRAARACHFVTAFFRVAVAFACAGCVAGCIPLRPRVPTATVTATRAKAVPAYWADAAAIGRSTKADVRAALGDTLVIGFDSGYEVWVYRLVNDGRSGARAPEAITRTAPHSPPRWRNAEFVVLFAPSGVVAKTRIRPERE